MLEEIVITMREKFEGHISEKLLSDYEIWIKNDELDKLPCMNFTISYDMGWQKRSGGRVYDSLRGHEFLTGCRS